MDFQEALRRAKAEKFEADYFIEFENAYAFSIKANERMRGGDSPVVVPKDGTQCLNVLYALQETSYLDGDVIREGCLDEQ